MFGNLTLPAPLTAAHFFHLAVSNIHLSVWWSTRARQTPSTTSQKIMKHLCRCRTEQNKERRKSVRQIAQKAKKKPQNKMIIQKQNQNGYNSNKLCVGVNQTKGREKNHQYEYYFSPSWKHLLYVQMLFCHMYCISIFCR